MAKLHLVIVTPEMTTLDKEVDMVVVTLVDGEAGILPGHAPMIGRLGPGELRARVGTSTESFYVDGGNIQVDNNVVSVLTGRSMLASEIDIKAARAALATAESESASTPALADLKHKAIAQAQAQVRLAEKA